MNTLAELFRTLDEQVAPDVKAEVKALDEASLWKMHFGFNGLIRSLAFYKNESTVGKEYFRRLGMPDDASGALGELYWRHLSSLPITQETVYQSLIQQWYFIPEEIQAVAKELVNSYEEYRNG